METKYILFYKQNESTKYISNLNKSEILRFMKNTLIDPKEILIIKGDVVKPFGVEIKDHGDVLKIFNPSFVQKSIGNQSNLIYHEKIDIKTIMEKNNG